MHSHHENLLETTLTHPLLPAESWCVSNLDVVRNTAGERVGVVGSLYNISKRKTRELKDLRDKEHDRALREADIAKAAAMEREMALLSKMSTVGLVRIDMEVRSSDFSPSLRPFAFLLALSLPSPVAEVRSLTDFFSQGHFIEANDAWYSIVKLPRDVPLDDWQTLVHPDDIDEIMSQWTEALQNLTPLEVTIRWIYDEISLVQAAPNHPDPAQVSRSEVFSRRRASGADAVLSRTGDWMDWIGHQRHGAEASRAGSSQRQSRSRGRRSQGRRGSRGSEGGGRRGEEATG